jgi:peptidyl-tRNA hydrolase
MKKLFVVVRADLEPGAQLAQSGHAISAFAISYEAEHRAWHQGSNNLVILAAKDEAHLLELARVAQAPFAIFREPDFENTVTAVAFHGDAARQLSSLPLALRSRHAA